MPIVVFVIMFPSWALAPSTVWLRILLFSFINKVGFLVTKGLLCLYDKQNNTRHLTRSLCSLLSSQSWTLEEKFHNYARPCIFLYLYSRQRGQYEVNPVNWLATRAGKVGSIGSPALIPREKKIALQTRLDFSSGFRLEQIIPGFFHIEIFFPL